MEAVAFVEFVPINSSAPSSNKQSNNSEADKCTRTTASSHPIQTNANTKMSLKISEARFKELPMCLKKTKCKKLNLLKDFTDTTPEE